tara:strand:- start:396 stop:608 length:213 start_codon:yes stop_codon:yes gene_type:complete
METQRRVEEIIKEVKELNRELDMIRTSCGHKSCIIKTIGINDTVKICDVCKDKVGYPTPDELKKWLGYLL